MNRDDFRERWCQRWQRRQRHQRRVPRLLPQHVRRQEAIQVGPQPAKVLEVAKLCSFQ